MGLFSRFTRPAWEKAAERGRKAASAGEHGVAARLLSDAMQRAPESEHDGLRKDRAKSALIVCEHNIAEAKTREAAGHVDKATEHYELAREFADAPELLAECDEALARLAQKQRAKESAAAEPAFANEELALDDDQTYGVLIGAFPDEIADVYEDRDAAFRSAFMAMHRGELDEALAAFRALATDDDAVAWIEIGRCSRGVGEGEAALEAFLKAEALAPEWNYVRLLAAECCLAQGNLDVAEDVLQRAVDFDDTDPAVFAAICRTSIAREDPGYGLEAAEAGLEINPNDRALRLYRARLNELAGNHQAALQGYEQRVQETWRYDAQEGKLFLDYDAAFFAAHLYRRLGENPKRAAELFRGLSAMCDPRERWVHELGLADVLLLDGKDKEAKGLLNDVERVVPKEQLLARCRIADLRDDGSLEPLLAELDATQRAAWDRSQAEREGR